MPQPSAPFASAALGTGHLRTPDLILIAVYLLAITIFGLRFRARTKTGTPDRSLKAYFLAGNTIPWWAIALSVVSAETSTLTIISIPGVAFAGNFGFLQVVLGYLLGRVVVAGLFLPRYFAGEMLTAYQLIDRRFGPVLHKVTAGLFLLTRAAAEGVRVFAVSIVVGIAIGTGDILSIAIISALTLLYTFEGGMAAVIWTDVVQMAIYIGGTLVALLSLGHHVPGGWTVIAHYASTAGKFHTFNYALNLTQSYTFWAGLLGGTFLTMASHGTDQLMVQRLLAARNLRESQWALLSSGVVIFFQFAFFLLIGAGLWVFYGLALGPHAAAAFRTNDYIFPTFIVREMPVGVAGLLVAAILAAAMSNLSAALNSLSSTTVVDFYIRARPLATERERTFIAKASTGLWAIVLFAIAVYSVGAGGKGHVVEIGLSIAAVAYGCLLGVFLLGTLIPPHSKYSPNERGAILGMICGFALNLWLWQGTFPVHLGPLTIPHIAFTWYVLIGAAATFVIGSLASLALRTGSRRKLGTAAALLLLFLLSFPQGICFAQTPAPAAMPSATVPDFTFVSTLINDAIAAHQLPGAVVVIGHSGEVVFQHAFGDRKLPGEPGLIPEPDGHSSPAEPMTEATLFDMASLTKCIVTATAIGQLYEQRKLSFDDPVEKYLPAFNPTHDPQRAKVTLRLLLTHFSGEAPDVDLKDSWGLAAPDKAEGLRRALTTPLAITPGTKFVYSDINFILLGTVVEKLSGKTLDVYAQEHIFKPLGMSETRYLPLSEACGDTMSVPPYSLQPGMQRSSTKIWECLVPFGAPQPWNATIIVPRSAPTAHDDEGTAQTNPNFNHLLRGTVHDPTTRRMGGVAGHAGVFSNAHDMSLFAQALLDRLAGRPSNFPLKRLTLESLTAPEQPGHTPFQVGEAYRANQAALAARPGAPPSRPSGAKVGFTITDPLLDPNFPAIKDQTLRGFGWDIDSGYSKPRGRVFPIGSFGHTGFTGTSLWMDPGSDTFVLLLSNAIHPHPGAAISNLRGEVASAAAQALGLYPDPSSAAYPTSQTSLTLPNAPKLTLASFASSTPRTLRSRFTPDAPPTPAGPRETLTGIDVLESTSEAPLLDLVAKKQHPIDIGLLTNQTGVDREGRRTADVLNDRALREKSVELTTLFSPEHGIFGQQDTTHLAAETDSATGIPVTSLYGPHDSDRRPSHDQLTDLDAVVIDLQDAGVRFYTYETVLGYFLEAAAKEKSEFHHELRIFVLDRPNPLGGVAVQGPVSDAGLESYTDFMPLPVRHGLTLGELARYINVTRQLGAELTVVPMQHWQRDQFYDQTGLPWINPSPNLRSLTAATLYPGVALLEMTNLSVGRGTATPFEVFGAGTPPRSAVPATSTAAASPPASASTPPVPSTAAAATTTAPTPPSGPWFHADAVAAALNARGIAGVRFEPTHVSVAEDKDRYPFHGQTIEAVHVILTDRNALDSPELGLEILSVLHRLYPTQFQLEKAARLLASHATMDALLRGEDPRHIALAWHPALESFEQARRSSLLY